MCFKKAPHYVLYCAKNVPHTARNLPILSLAQIIWNDWLSTPYTIFPYYKGIRSFKHPLNRKNLILRLTLVHRVGCLKVFFFHRTLLLVDGKFAQDLRPLPQKFYNDALFNRCVHLLLAHTNSQSALTAQIAAVLFGFVQKIPYFSEIETNDGDALVIMKSSWSSPVGTWKIFVNLNAYNFDYHYKFFYIFREKAHQS